ncbi:MAG: hypothetical protein GKR94_07460 [Gammaproteobacteria bacterium]|nr:hypothetical protein [Gammaproteobacteria bacterium]
MDLLANDLSVHEQFRDLAGFRDALSQLMALRGTARRFGREIQCHRTILNTRPIAGMSMQQAIGNLGLESRRAIMTWLTRTGPFWDDVRRHGEDDWLECKGEIVTDTAVGEAAFRILHGVECGLVSLTQSAWCCSPLGVTWVLEAEGIDNRNVDVENWWRAETLEGAMRSRAAPLGSWDELREAAGKRFANLMFADDCFAPLDGIPFAKSAADRFLVLLDVLDRFAGAFGDDGAHDAEGHRIYQDYFTGERALFSDSSDSEKRDFRHELTFIHPEDPASSLFCTWHGKISHLTLRLHFSWPVAADRPVYVVYAGPKITKR